MFVIIGCPRSGFSYTTTVLRQAGLMVNHERWDDAGIIGWQMTCEELPSDAVVLHQVRHPLNVIGSMQIISGNSWRLLCEHTSAKMEMEVVERGMRAYLGWNRLAESKAQYSYRVEDIATEWPRICELAGLGDTPLPGVNKAMNHRRNYTRQTWADLHDINVDLALDIAAYYRTLGGEGYGMEGHGDSLHDRQQQGDQDSARVHHPGTD